MRILALVTDAYGGRGGIAQHNRHLLDALCIAPQVAEVVALPRLVVEPPGLLPDGLTYVTAAARGKAAYLQALLALGLWRSTFETVVCGHLNLLPLAVLAAVRHRARLLLVVHGIEAWTPRGEVVKRMLRRVDEIVAVSSFTRRRFLAWSGVGEARARVIPNAIDLGAYGPGPKRPDLVARYGLEGKKVILTLGRMDARERYKGHDELLDVLPALAKEEGRLAWLVVGDGDDRPRLEAKARALGVADHVVFAGYVPDGEKADHYRLADVFAMPGRGEGFGIVYLEALACGIPVVASSADASREAVSDGRMGEVVDPEDRAALLAGLRRAFARAGGRVPAGLDTFSVSRFRARWHGLLSATPALPTPALSVRKGTPISPERAHA
ncbi:MAG TPA: glycosyltransferase family 4 protein [Rubricoccaceae bacterium]|nr:glycosyltransferase family 4 protein [Rubricoccaceae bacterium]